MDIPEPFGPRVQLVTPQVTPQPLELTVGEGLELLLQGDGGIVGPEDFGRQTIHEVLEVFVQEVCLEEGKQGKSVGKLTSGILVVGQGGMASN